jgi:type IV pilus assembly protein PilM
MPATALDIGTYSVKAVAAERTGPTPVITRAVEIANPFGAAVPTDDLQMEQLSGLVKNVLTDHKLPTNDVRLSLPEAVVSSKVISIPPLTDAELASAIGWQAEQYIPIPKEDLSLQYKILYRPVKGDTQTMMRVLLTGTRKSLVERYVSIFTAAGIEPTFLETHILSVLRSLGITKEEPPTLVVNVGATNMDVMAVSEGEILFVFTHSGAGSLMTKSLQQIIGLDTEQAEEYKRMYGLDPAQFEGKVRNALLPTINNLTAEVQKALRYFTTQFPQSSIQRVVLAGGSAQLPGLIEHLSDTLGIEVLLSAPFATATGEVPAANHQAFAVCMGLIMRGG